MDKLAARYSGRAAAEYEAIRRGTAKWGFEEDAVRQILPIGVRTILDVPVGTGRFLPLYAERAPGACIVGVDKSRDMLREARRKGRHFDLEGGDIRSLPWPDRVFDVAVCIRLLGWLDPDDMLKAVGELCRVAAFVIAGIRTGERAREASGLWIHPECEFLGAFEACGFELADARHLGAYGIFGLRSC